MNQSVLLSQACERVHTGVACQARGEIALLSLVSVEYQLRRGERSLVEPKVAPWKLVLPLWIFILLQVLNLVC